MKKEWIIIALIGLLVFAVLPVQAGNYANLSHATIGAPWIGGVNYTMSDPANQVQTHAQICAAYGANTWSTDFWADGHWVGAGEYTASTIPSPSDLHSVHLNYYPAYMTLNPVNYGPLVHFIAPIAMCTGGNMPVSESAAATVIHPYYNSTAYLPNDSVNFAGYPLDGYAPLNVGFTISNYTSVNGSVSWTFGDGQTLTAASSIANHTYTNPGIFTVSLTYSNFIGNTFTITKTNYILTSNQTGAVVNLDVKNAITGALIQDSTVGIQNTTTGVWRNTTAPTGLVYFSTTDPGYLYSLSIGQSIQLAANKTGYSSASETFNIPYNEYRSRLFLMPTTVVNATGTGTVVANVIRNKDGLTLSGASVVLDSGQMGATNTAGAVTLYNVTAGQRYASVTDVGYQSTQYSFNLTAGETKLIVIQMVRNGETPVPTMVTPGATIAPNSTYDPNDPNSPVYGNKTVSQINIEGGAGVLGMLSQLIELWPAILLLAFLKFAKSAFS